MEPMEMVEIDIDEAGNVLPDKHDKLLIVDADTIAFASCSVCQYEAEIIGEVMPEDKLKLHWDDDTQTYMGINLNEALEHAKGKIKLILDRIGGKEENVRLYFTGGKDSFRYHLLKEFFPDTVERHYKFKRTKKKSPAGLQDLKTMLCKEYKGIIYYNFEADDIVVLKKKQHMDQAILCAVDKDVILNTPGKHWNYYDSPHYNIGMKWVEVNEGEARANQYRQVLTGDSSDNVPGLYRVGKKGAEKAITTDMSEDEMKDVILSMYKQKCDYGDYALMAQLNMQLVNMHQLQEDMTIKLWTFMEAEMISEEQVKENIDTYGVKYTASIWQKAKSRKKPLTKEESDLFHLVQQAHLGFTGYSLPPIPGARKTRAQSRDELGPQVKDEVIEKAVQGGLAARLAAMRKGK